VLNIGKIFEGDSMKKILFISLLLSFSVPAIAKKYGNLTCRYTDQEQLGDEQGKYVQVKGYLMINGDDDAVLMAATNYINFGAKIVSGKIVIVNAETFSSDRTKIQNVKGYSQRAKLYKNHFKFPVLGVNLNTNADLIISKEAKEVKKRTAWGTGVVFVFDATLNVSYDDHHGDYVKMKCEATYVED